MKNFLSPGYLFNKNLGPFTSNLAWYFLGGVLAVMAATWLIRRKLVKNKDIFAKKAARKLWQSVWVMGWIIIVFWIFREINVMYLSAPVFLLASIATGLVWLMFVAYYWFKIVPKRRARLGQDGSKKRYLP